MPLFGDWLVQFSIYYWFGFPFVARMELTAKHVYLHYEILLNKEELIKLLQHWPMPWTLPATPHDCSALGGTGMWHSTRGLSDGSVPRETSAFPARHCKSLPAMARASITSSLPKIGVHTIGSTESSHTAFLTKRPWGHSVRTSVWSCLNPAGHSWTFLWNSWPQSLWFGIPSQYLPYLAGMTTVSSTEWCLLHIPSTSQERVSAEGLRTLRVIPKGFHYSRCSRNKKHSVL